MNYKSKMSHVTTRVTTPLYEDTAQIDVASSSTLDVFGAWVQFSADIGTNKKLYGISVQCGQTPVGGKGCIFEIAEGASSSEVVVQRIPLCEMNANLVVVYLYLALTDNARIACRVKDGESNANTHEINLMVA